MEKRTLLFMLAVAAAFFILNFFFQWFVYLSFAVLIGILAAHEAQEDLRKMAPKHMLASRPFILNAGRLVPVAIVFFFMVGWLAIFAKH